MHNSLGFITFKRHAKAQILVFQCKLLRFRAHPREEMTISFAAQVLPAEGLPEYFKYTFA